MDSNKVEISTGFVLGCYSDSYRLGMDGSISLVEIYNKVLTAEEASNLYNDARYVLPNLEHGEQLGSELITEFTNNAGYAFETFVSNGVNITSAINTAGGASCYSNTLGAGVVGDLYKVVYTITINSGTISQMYLGSGAGISNRSNVHTPVPNVETTVYFRVHTAITNIYLDFETALAVNCSIVISSCRKVIVESTSKILNVTAIGGVCRNLLSGDVHGGNLIPIASSQFETDGTAWWSVGSGTKSWNSDGYIEIIGAGGTAFIWVGSVIENGKTYRGSLKFRSSSYTGRIIAYGATSSTSTESVDTTTEWQTYNFEFTTTDGLFYIQCRTVFTGIVDMDDIILEEVIPEVVNTDIEVVKDSPGRVPRFNGETSNVNLGDYNDLLGDISILTWIKLKIWGEGVSGRGKILDNRKLSFGVSGGSGVISFNRNDGSLDTTGAPIGLFEWFFVAVVSNASGISDIYINGELEIADHDAGTPVVPTETLRIGDHGDGGGRAFGGQIPETIVLSGLLTAAEISQYFSSTKHLYNK